jgi:putative methionine-R-sulfoxide reductase with GAF domain
LKSTMCVIASVVILSELVVDGVAGAVLVGVVEADSRTTAMFGNMREVK